MTETLAAIRSDFQQARTRYAVLQANPPHWEAVEASEWADHSIVPEEHDTWFREEWNACVLMARLLVAAEVAQ